MAPRRNRQRRSAGRRKPWYMRKRVAKRKTYNPTFSETFNAGGLQLNSGGMFRVRFNDIPQRADYAALYKQFAIRRMKVTIVPRLNSFDPNVNGVAASIWQPRIVYAVNDTPITLNPAAEIDVLTDNGCKIRTLNNKPLSISCVPKPELVMNDLAGNRITMRQKKLVWLNLDSPDTNYNGQDVLHSGISYWISGNPSIAGDFVFDVYIKVTFSVRDPA